MEFLAAKNSKPSKGRDLIYERADDAAKPYAEPAADPMPGQGNKIPRELRTCLNTNQQRKMDKKEDRGPWLSKRISSSSN